MSDTGFIFFCHGAREPRWREPFELILQQFKLAMPDADSRLAFLELMEPRLPAVIDEMAANGIIKIQVMPLFLAAGGHTRRDLPELIASARQRWPDLTLDCASTLTESVEIRQAIVRWARDLAAQGPNT
ncbi:MAG: CbiX/SirB N-terminal domain-containing protein [Burkholderiaceae bacterium]